MIQQRAVSSITFSLLNQYDLPLLFEMITSCLKMTQLMPFSDSG